MASKSIKTKGPNYTNPPLAEVILGVQFERLGGMGNAHLGAFWKSLGSDWSEVSDAPVLQPQYERFGESAAWANLGARLTFSADHAGRLRIKNHEKNQMVQVQNGRLHFNWLGEGGIGYPRYETVRKGFSKLLTRFVEFVRQENLGAIKVNQWEITYLNHIDQGTVWNSPKDWGFFRPLAGLPTIDGHIEGESFGGEWHFVIPEKRGRLHVNWQHGAKLNPEMKQVIILNFTARGSTSDENGEPVNAVLSGLDLGHRTVVLAFQKLMSDAANRYWGLDNAGD